MWNVPEFIRTRKFGCYYVRELKIVFSFFNGKRAYANVYAFRHLAFSHFPLDAFYTIMNIRFSQRRLPCLFPRSCCALASLLWKVYYTIYTLYYERYIILYTHTHTHTHIHTQGDSRNLHTREITFKLCVQWTIVRGFKGGKIWRGNFFAT